MTPPTTAACSHRRVSVSEPGHFEKCLDCGAYLPASDAAEIRADEPFGTVEGGIPMPESMKGVTLIDAKDVPPPTFERDAADVRYVTPKRPLHRIKVRVRLLASRVPKVSK